MAREIITPEDLEIVKEDIIQEIQKLQLNEQILPKKKWLRSSHVCEYLCISKSSLQNLRQSGVLPYTQLCESGTIFYKMEDIDNILNNNLKNSSDNDKA